MDFESAMQTFAEAWCAAAASAKTEVIAGSVNGNNDAAEERCGGGGVAHISAGRDDEKVVTGELHVRVRECESSLVKNSVQNGLNRLQMVQSLSLSHSEFPFPHY